MTAPGFTKTTSQQRPASRPGAGRGVRCAALEGQLGRASASGGRSSEKTAAFHDYPGSMRDEARSRLAGIAETAEGESVAEQNVGLSGNIRGEVKLQTGQTAEPAKSEG